jgi:hypothetical protein
LHQQAEVRIRQEALDELRAEKDRILAQRMTLLAEGQEPAATE